MKKLSDRYGIYSLKTPELIAAASAGAAIGAVGSLTMFRSVYAVIFFAVITAVAAVPVSKKAVKRKRHENVRRQFRDFLESLCGAFSGGSNAREAFERAYGDIRFSYGEKAVFVRETGRMLRESKNGRGFEDLLLEMAHRLDDSSVSEFAETFAVCLKKGGNLMYIANECRDIINVKIDAEREIAMSTASNRNELNVLTAMPFIIALIMKETGTDFNGGDTRSVLWARAACIVLTAAAYFIGMKITDIGV